jgi:hypothetical protein
MTNTPINTQIQQLRETINNPQCSQERRRAAESALRVLVDAVMKQHLAHPQQQLPPLEG